MISENKVITKTSPLLSVVMAVYNGEKHLHESIDSVLLQTYSRFELIIVNDGSTDESEYIIREYAEKDKRIIYLKNDLNLGQSKTRNKAINIAKGEYIVIVDSDDICLPDRFEKQIMFFEKNPNVDVLGSDYCLFSGSLKDDCRMVVSANAGDIYNGKPPVHNPTCMIKRSIFYSYGFYDPAYDNAEDAELWFRWFSQDVYFDNISEVLYKKRNHSGSVSISNIRPQVYLMLKINLIAIFKYRIRFTMYGYLRMLEQLFYLIYLLLGLNVIYKKR